VLLELAHRLNDIWLPALRRMQPVVCGADSFKPLVTAGTGQSMRVVTVDSQSAEQRGRAVHHFGRAENGR